MILFSFCIVEKHLLQLLVQFSELNWLWFNKLKYILVLMGAIITKLISLRSWNIFVTPQSIVDKYGDYLTVIGATFCHACLAKSVPVTLQWCYLILKTKTSISLTRIAYAGGAKREFKRCCIEDFTEWCCYSAYCPFIFRGWIISSTAASYISVWNTKMWVFFDINYLRIKQWIKKRNEEHV